MFSVTEIRDFTLFSMAHIVTLILFFSTCCVLMFYRKKLKTYQPIIKWTLFSILLVYEISLHLWLILTKEWEVGDLPLQLCSLSTSLALFLFLKKNQKAFNLLFFYRYPSSYFRYGYTWYGLPISSFSSHKIFPSAFSYSVLYFILFEGYRVPKKTIFFSFLSVNIIAIPIFFLNQLLGTNFFFLASPSETKTLLTFFGSGTMYYINLEIVALIVFIITYIPMGILQKIE